MPGDKNKYCVIPTLSALLGGNFVQLSGFVIPTGVAAAGGNAVEGPAFYILGNCSMQQRTSETHNVVAAVHVDHFTGNAGSQVGSQKGSGSTHFCLLCIAMQRSSAGMGGSTRDEL